MAPSTIATVIELGRKGLQIQRYRGLGETQESNQRCPSASAAIETQTSGHGTLDAHPGDGGQLPSTVPARPLVTSARFPTAMR